MQNEVIDTVLEITGKTGDKKFLLSVHALLSQILSYLNRDEINDEIFPSVVEVIVNCLESGDLNSDRIQSLKEGDMSVTYSNLSPFFGKLDSFKVIRGINNVQK